MRHVVCFTQMRAWGTAGNTETALEFMWSSGPPCSRGVSNPRVPGEHFLLTQAPWSSDGGAGCVGMDCRVWGPPGQYEGSGVPGGCSGMSSPFLLRVAAQEGGPGSRSRSRAGVLQPELLREAPSLRTQGDACRPDGERGRGLGDDLRGAGFAKWAVACLGDFEEGKGHRGPGGSHSLEGTGPPTGPG